MEPSDNTYRQVAPKSLTPFYFIQFIDCYWIQLLSERAEAGGAFFYSDWTQKMLGPAPQVSGDWAVDHFPNLYVLGVNKMLSNIHGWVNLVTSKNYSDFEWAAIHFAELKLWVLKEIEEKFISKVSKRWLIEEKVVQFFSELILCRNTFKEKFIVPKLEEYISKSEFKNEAFAKLTDEKFFSNKYPSEAKKKNSGYEWLKKIIEENS